MNVSGQAAIVTGGASGLGAATARLLAEKGVKVTVVDLNEELANAMATEIGGVAAICDVSSEEQMTAALVTGRAAHGPARILVNCAGIGAGARTVGRNGPHSLSMFTKVITVNLIGTFNAIRLFAAEACELDPLADEERGVIVGTASVAAFDGQIGQAAYSASKGGIVGMTLPIARDLSGKGVRMCTIAPGVLNTPLMGTLPQEAQDALGASVPFPKRLGHAEEYAALAVHICENTYLNAETIRIDGALRMAPK
jgi:NAD(P)-dependent dehydrogenase (short-subunit alcohol dehydrogenase family)